MPELNEKKRIIAYDTVNDPDENYYALIDNGTAGTGKVSIKGLGPADMISDQYSDSSTYKVGDLCIHNNKLYVCTVAINTPHAFNLSEWELDTLGNYASEIKQSITTINSALSDLAADTGWKTVTSSYGDIRVRKIGKVVELFIWSDKAIPTNQQLATLAAAYKPIIPVYPNRLYMRNEISTTANITLYIDNNGIIANTGNANSAGQWVVIHTMWTTYPLPS